MRRRIRHRPRLHLSHRLASASANAASLRTWATKRAAGAASGNPIGEMIFNSFTSSIPFRRSATSCPALTSSATAAAITSETPRPARTARLTASVFPKPPMAVKPSAECPSSFLKSVIVPVPASPPKRVWLASSLASIALPRGPGVIGGDNDDERFLSPGMSAKAGPIAPPLHQRHVGGTVCQPVGDVGVGTDPQIEGTRIGRLKGSKHGLQQISADVARRCNAQGSLGDHGSAALGGIEHRAGKRREGRALRCRLDNSAPAHDAAARPGLPQVA